MHLVVVDPGVGTGRKALALEAEGRFVVAPDNGVASRVLDQADGWRAVEVGPQPAAPGRSATFHGRDVFAPAAGRLAAGEALEELGGSLPDPIRIREPRPRPLEGGGLAGEVVSVDRFGNLITNLMGDDLARGATVEAGGRELGLFRTYGEVAAGELLALVGSDGRVEVAVRDGSAAGTLGLGRGSAVVARPPTRT